ncbi:MAG: hypothetical protein AAGF89_05880 [Bacteroidota bacterium]
MGLTLRVVSSLSLTPTATPAFVPDAFMDTGDGRGFTWGLCHFIDTGTGKKRYFLMA